MKKICAFWKNLKEKKKKRAQKATEKRPYDQDDGNFGELLGWSEIEVEQRALRLLETKEETPSTALFNVWKPEETIPCETEYPR